MAFTIKEIQEKKAALRQRRHELEEEILTEVFNPQVILSSIATGLASKYLLPKVNKEVNNESFIYKKIVSKDSSGILSSIYSFVNHPIVSALLVRTRKSWFKWQLFNLGIFLIKKGYDYYKNHQHTDAEIIEAKKSPPKLLKKIKQSIFPWK